jgi:hypothetical protein
VRFNAAPRSGNWVTFGLAKTGMEASETSGFGRTENTWGLADNRSTTDNTNAGFYAGSLTSVRDLPRKLQAGDVLYGEVDVNAGWFEVRLNSTEFTHRFHTPKGRKEDYVLGMTLANSYQATIAVDNVFTVTGTARVTRMITN